MTHGVAALERGLALLEGSLAETGGAAQPMPVRGHIVLQQVGLQFGDDLAPALQHIDLEVQPGQVVALRGPLGGGKTTLVNLLPRFLEPNSGQVLIGRRAAAAVGIWPICASNLPWSAKTW